VVGLPQHDLGVLNVTDVHQQVARSDEVMHMPLHVQRAAECVAKQPINPIQSVTAALLRQQKVAK
jgi:hypothetical protein